MSTTARPVFRVLHRGECEVILARNHVGRLAYARRNQIDIEPVHYVLSGGWLYGRTSEGRKIAMTGHAWWPVAFEVDEVEDLFRWRSVVVHGGFYPLPHGPAGSEPAEWHRGVAALRTLLPDTFGPDDPVPFRTLLFRVAVQELSGREAMPAGEEPA